MVVLKASTLVLCTMLAAHGQQPPVVAPTKQMVPSRVTNRPGDPMGRVLIIMYHHFGPEDSKYVRSYSSFKSDLERLRTSGFRPVTMREYTTNQMNLPSGASPVVLTFDDAFIDQLRIRKDGSIDPNCAFGIWQDFAKEHPDFPNKGVYYVVTSMMFGQKRLIDRKLAMLKASGCEVGNHTVHHPQLSKLSDEKAVKEISGAYDYLEKKGVTDIAFALPYGIWPKHKMLAKKFTYGGKHYEHASVVLAGDAPAHSPVSPKFDRYKIPRVIANGSNEGLIHWLNELDRGKFKPYVQP